MRTRGARKPLDYALVLGVGAALGIVLVAQRLEGATIRALWQPTAALVVFGGTAAAVVISFPIEVVVRTVRAVIEAFRAQTDSIELVLRQILQFSQQSRRKGLIALETEIDSTRDPFLRAGLMLAVDGTNSKTTRQILEIESETRLEFDEVPGQVLETAAGYAPTLGILGAVLGLIHVMESLSEPSKLGAGIAVAFVATVYGVASANLLLLPLATKLRGRARRAALTREVVVEGIVALQEGLNPKLIELKLSGFLAATEASQTRRAA